MWPVPPMTTTRTGSPLGRRDPYAHCTRFPVGPGVVGNSDQLDVGTEILGRGGITVRPPSRRTVTWAHLALRGQGHNATQQVRSQVGRYRRGGIDYYVVEPEISRLIDGLQAIDQRTPLESNGTSDGVDPRVARHDTHVHAQFHGHGVTELPIAGDSQPAVLRL